MEVLESRSLLSVSLGSDGFTDINPSGDSKIIYVSSSSGSDSNNGSQGSPVKSVAKGLSLARSGYPDHVLLKRGDSWTESNISWTKSGRSSQEPMLLGAYGSGSRPLIKAGKNNGLQMASGNVNNIAIQGIHLFAHTRDPDASGFSRTEGGYGIRFVAGTTSALIEDTVVDQFGFNLLFQAFNSPQSNVKLRRNIITDAYSTSGSHASGIYAQGVTNLTLEENVWDHNGWNEDVSGGGATAQNHNAYLSEKNNNVVVRGNVFANGSSHGLQTRAGGVVENNVFIRNPIHMSFGLVNGAALKAGGVTGSVKGNVFLESRNIGSAARGWAVDLGNIKSATVSDNIFNDGGAARMGAIVINPGNDLHNASQGVGVNNLTIENNIVNDWFKAVEISNSMKPGGSGTTGIKNLTVRDNDFQYSYGPYNRLVSHPSSYSTSQEKWSNNRYYDESPTREWFFMGSDMVSLAEWQDKLEPTAKNVKVSYSNPNAGVNGYAGSYGAFMSDVRKQSSTNWEGGPATGLINYVRKGFNQSTSPTPTPTPTTPTPTPTPPPASHDGPEIAIADAAIAEGNNGTQQLKFPVTLSAATSETVKVNFATNNKTAGEGDYGVTSGSLTFSPGETAKTVSVDVKGDTKIESDEEFRVNLSGASNATIIASQAAGMILNDDGGAVPVVPTPTPTTPTPTPTTPTPTPAISIADVAVAEGNSGTKQVAFPVTLSGASSKTVKVNFATDNRTAGEGDYSRTSGSVTFAPGETSKTVSVEVKGDTKIESDEQFKVNLSGVSNATIARSQAFGTILNDDGGTVPKVPPVVTPTPTTPDAAPTVVSRSGDGYAVKIQFSENVAASLSAKDLVLKHPSKGLNVYESLKLSYNTSTNTATWTWSNLGKLQSGTWSVTLPSSTVSDASGNPLANGNFTFTFTV